MEILKSAVILVIGFVLLIKGADYFVEGSSSVAKKFKVPSLIIGMTIVAMGQKRFSKLLVEKDIVVIFRSGLLQRLGRSRREEAVEIGVPVGRRPLQAERQDDTRHNHGRTGSGYSPAQQRPRRNPAKPRTLRIRRIQAAADTRMQRLEGRLGEFIRHAPIIRFKRFVHHSSLNICFSFSTAWW